MNAVLCFVLVFAAAVGSALSGCSSNGGAPGGDGGSVGDGRSEDAGRSVGDGGPDGDGSLGSCTLGQPLPDGCADCECINGIWQAVVCYEPTTGIACAVEGASCGYATSTNPCGAVDCYCQDGAWSCGPTCVIDASTGTRDATAD